ncbi:MAG: DoxX family protein [Asticcacaulis sp.]
MFKLTIKSLNDLTAQIIERFDHKLWLVRLLMAAMFLESAIDKILHWTRYVSEVNAHHIPFPEIALFMAASVELAGSAALLTGFALAPALLALAAYTLIINIFYFDFWNLPLPDAIMARKEFLKNLAVAGGLLAYMIDALRANITKTKG